MADREDPGRRGGRGGRSPRGPGGRGNRGGTNTSIGERYVQHPSEDSQEPQDGQRRSNASEPCTGYGYNSRHLGQPQGAGGSRGSRGERGGRGGERGGRVGERGGREGERGGRGGERGGRGEGERGGRGGGERGGRGGGERGGRGEGERGGRGGGGRGGYERGGRGGGERGERGGGERGGRGGGERGGRGGGERGGRGEGERGGRGGGERGGRGGGERGGGERGGRGGGERGGGGRGGGERGGGERGGRGGGERGGRGGGERGGRGGGRSTITFSREPLSLDNRHVDGPMGFKVPVLPEKPDGFKALIPKDVKPGTLSQRKVHIQINQILANVQLPEELFRYNVAITKTPRAAAAPQPEGATPQRPLNKNLRFKIFRQMIPRIQEEWALNNSNGRLGILHDWSQIMVTNGRLNTSLEYQVAHKELEDEDNSEVNYRVVIAEAELAVHIPQLQGALNDLRNARETEGLETIEQFYNILLKNIGGDSYLPFGRSSLLKIPEDIHDERSLPRHLGYGLCNWKGITAVYTMQSSWKPYINIDIQKSAFRIGQSVDDAVQEILWTLDSKRDPRDRADWRDVRTWTPRHFGAVSDLLKSCKVSRRIPGNGRFDGVVKEVLRSPAEEVTFHWTEKNRTVTVPQYYLENRIPIENPSGLLLQIGAKAKVPAELCTIKKGQSLNRMPTNNVVAKNILRQATQSPQQKKDDILAAIEDLQMTNHPILNDFGVRFSGQLLDLKETRVLSPPELCYGEAYGSDSKDSPPNRGRITPQNGEWDQWFHDVKFFESVDIDSWAIIILEDTKNIRSDVFIRALQENGAKAGMNIPDPARIDLKHDIRERGNHNQNRDSIAGIIKGWKQEFQWTKQKKTFVLVVIPWKGCNLYYQTKQAAELDAGVLTQCLTKDNFNQADPSVVKNILLKLNLKLGGINNVAVIPKHLEKIDILKTPVMIVGIDVNHPSPGHGGRVPQPSFAAVTASIDRSGMPYMMDIKAQIKAERGAAEVVQDLDIIIEKMLRTFMATTEKRNNGIAIKPSKIIVYRDGVGTTQFPEVLDIEMRAVRKACTKFLDDDSNSYCPKITIIAVQKRHKVRFFLQNNGKSENAPPGTVVDTEITKSDFYLLSHKGALGTSRPTHYQVLWDDSDFSSDEIQALTYFLCYMYCRCNKAVSYPAPTYYAHWAAKRANALCKINGYLPTWWNGTPTDLARLNQSLNRKEDFTAGFPMHFV